MVFWSGFAVKKSGFTVKKMRCGTGVKTRVIRAFDVSALEPFEFNRSINRRGGSLAKIQILTNRKWGSIASIDQDTNSDSKVSCKELICRGKSRNVCTSNELVNFLGTGRPKKKQCVNLTGYQ